MSVLKDITSSLNTLSLYLQAWIVDPGQDERVWQHDQLEHGRWYEHLEWSDLWNMAAFIQVREREETEWCGIMMYLYVLGLGSGSGSGLGLGLGFQG